MALFPPRLQLNFKCLFNQNRYEKVSNQFLIYSIFLITIFLRGTKTLFALRDLKSLHTFHKLLVHILQHLIFIENSLTLFSYFLKLYFDLTPLNCFYEYQNFK